MFAAGGHVDTTMMENTMEEASESMQDVSETASDMEMEEQKKRERNPKQTQETATVTLDTVSPEQKKMRNEQTSSKQAPVKVLFPAATEAMAVETTRQTIDMTSSHTTDMAIIEEETALKQDSMYVVHHTVTETKSVEGIEENIASTLQKSEPEEPSQEKASSLTQATHNTSSTTHIKNNSVVNVNDKPSEMANEKETATHMSKKAVTFEVTTTPPAQPTKLSPKEWCALQDEWLHSTMQAEMDDESLQGIPTMSGYCEGKQSLMANKKNGCGSNSRVYC